MAQQYLVQKYGRSFGVPEICSTMPSRCRKVGRSHFGDAVMAVDPEEPELDADGLAKVGIHPFTRVSNTTNWCHHPSPRNSTYCKYKRGKHAQLLNCKATRFQKKKL